MSRSRIAMRWIVGTALAALAGPPAAAQTPPGLMTPQQLLATPFEAPDEVIRYGDDPNQFVELRVPGGAGPFPVVVLVHGGCFRDFASASSIGPMGDALKREGIASWSIEFRRLGQPGAGWPGTYLDVGSAIDALKASASQHRLDLTRVVFVGHSAGAHLAHWAAGRHRVSPQSAIYREAPLIPRGVVNLAGRMDMAEGIEGYEKICGRPVVHEMMGGAPSEVPDHYAAASPSSLAPTGVPQTMIWGEFEDNVPEAELLSFVTHAEASGDRIEVIKVPGVGHFETASPNTVAWPTVRAAIFELIGAAPTGQ